MSGTSRRLKMVIVALWLVLVIGPTIFMAVWGVHHLPGWWYRLPRLPWVSDFERQLAAVFGVFFLGLMMIFPVMMIIRFICGDWLGWPLGED